MQIFRALQPAWNLGFCIFFGKNKKLGWRNQIPDLSSFRCHQPTPTTNQPTKTMQTEVNYSLNQIAPVMTRLMEYLNSSEGKAITNSIQPFHRAVSYKIENYELVVYPYGIVLRRDGLQIHSSKTRITHVSSKLLK
jgi:hypothetical protein